MEGGWETPPVRCQQPQELALTCLTKPAPGQSPWKEKEARVKFLACLKATELPWGRFCWSSTALHTPAALGREWDGAGMGQDWVSTGGEPWERCLAGCWIGTKQDPTVSLFPVTRLLRFELFHGEGQLMAARQDRDLGRWWQVLPCPTEPWVIPLIPGKAVLCRARPGAWRCPSPPQCQALARGAGVLQDTGSQENGDGTSLGCLSPSAGAT